MENDEMLRLVQAVSAVQALVPDAPLGAVSAAVRKCNFDVARAADQLLRAASEAAGGASAAEPVLLLPPVATAATGSAATARKCVFCETLNEAGNTKCFVCDTPIKAAVPAAGPLANSNNPVKSAAVSRAPDPIDAMELPPEYEDLSASTERAVKTMLYEEQQERERVARREEQLTSQYLAEEQRARQRELDAKTYPCSICFDELKIDAIYILEECTHRFCRDCLADHIKSNVVEANTRNIHCPYGGCQHVISYTEVKHVVDEATMAKFELFLLRAALGDDPNCVWCPRPGCGVATINEGGLMVRCSSDACRYAWCRKCKDPWHADVTCEQYQQWKVENGQGDTLFAAWAKANTKPCPKCHAHIQKNEGCNHMTCRAPHCKHEFCWLCLEDYKSGHFNNGKCKQFT